MGVLELQENLNEKYANRADAIRTLLTGVLLKQHVYVHGPVGSGKSALINDLMGALPGSSFSASLSRTRPAEAILGPYDIQGLQESKFVRHDAGYLTTARWVFLDEIGKANPIIGHDLLAALNERVKHEVNNGRNVHEIPLETAFTASNEQPSGEDFEALWDRLALRTTVNYTKDLTQLWDAAHNTTPIMPITDKELTQARDAIKAIPINPHHIMRTIQPLAGTISDRRLLLAPNIIQTAVYLDGRTTPTPYDLLSLAMLTDSGKPNTTITTITEKAAQQDLFNESQTFQQLKDNALQLAHLENQ